MILTPSLTFSQEADKNTSDKILTEANLCFEKQQYDSAILLYKKFLSVIGLPRGSNDPERINRKNKIMEAQVSMQIANIYTLKGEYTSAESFYHKALNLVENSGSLKAEVYQNLGSLYFLKENYEYAILYYQKSWTIYSKEPGKNSFQTVDLLTSLGTTYSANGEYQKSLSCFQKADSVLKILKTNDPIRFSVLNINIGEVMLKLDAPAKALNRYRSAGNLASFTSNSSINVLISSKEGMAECYTRLGMTDSAMVCLENCLELIKPTAGNLKHERSRIYLFMGNVQARKDDWEKSLKYYNRSMEILLQDTLNLSFDEGSLRRHEPDLLDLYKIFELRGRSRLQSAIHAGFDTVSLSCSFKDFLTALKICEHISRDFGQGTSRMAFNESTKSILAGAIESGFFLKEKKGTPEINDLFTLADVNKNRMLLADMEENRIMKLSGIPDSVIKKINELKDEIVFYSRKYVRDDPSPITYPQTGLNELQNKMIDLKLQLDSLRRMIELFYPDYSMQTKHDWKRDPSGIMKYLRKDEAILEYLCTDSVIYLFLVRTDGLSMKRVVLHPSFNVSMKECLYQLKSGGIRDFSTLGRNLYNCLIAPVDPGLTGIRRLIIIPDEELSLFPFETLIRAEPAGTKVTESNGTNSSSWHYLIRDFEITYHFSAEAWFRDTIQAKQDTGFYRFAGFAPVFRNNPDKEPSMNPLPFAMKEVSGIAGLFEQETGHQFVFLDTAATEKNFRGHAPGSTHIHIATHSLISESDPMNSALVFSKCKYPGDQQDKNDGLLHLDEISNLRLNASLVVLSACATGKGKVTRTEGVLALTRGIYLAGASNVVYSLWNIPDHLTSEFMLNFYRSYFHIKSYSTALRDVKLKMISRSETSLPYIWAGIVLLGR